MASGKVNQSQGGIAAASSYVANDVADTAEPTKTTMNNDSGDESGAATDFIDRAVGGVGGGSTIPR